MILGQEMQKGKGGKPPITNAQKPSNKPEPSVAINFTLSELEFIASTMGMATIQIAEAFKAVKTLSKIQEGYLTLKSTPQK